MTNHCKFIQTDCFDVSSVQWSAVSEHYNNDQSKAECSSITLSPGLRTCKAKDKCIIHLTSQENLSSSQIFQINKLHSLITLFVLYTCFTGSLIYYSGDDLGLLNNVWVKLDSMIYFVNWPLSPSFTGPDLPLQFSFIDFCKLWIG